MATGRPGRLLLVTAIAVWTADLLVLGLKALVERPRPFETVPGLETLMGASGHSMPSGHAATSFAGLVVLAAAAPRLAPALVVLAVAIAFSRVYVGVHYVTDVVAGATIGAVVGAVVLSITPLRWRAAGRPPPRRDPPPG